ncbi:MAG: hypothetical protein HC769_37770, partial [Cyanobacteria bacterium CRU_2_1]|nr:hypothetical protein [Cyanobacteria bacterium CRU_2_1]
GQTYVSADRSHHQQKFTDGKIYRWNFGVGADLCVCPTDRIINKKFTGGNFWIAIA